MSRDAVLIEVINADFFQAWPEQWLEDVSYPISQLIYVWIPASAALHSCCHIAYQTLTTASLLVALVVNMAFVWQAIGLISFIFSYVYTSRASSNWAAPFFKNFAAASAVQLFAWAIWRVFLYPYCFSPLRSLPGPKDSPFLLGQVKKIITGNMGDVMLNWIDTIPNNGVIRYLTLFNQERILVTSPQALTDILVTKAYDFEKPRPLRLTLGQTLGVGLLFAEGEEHKSQRRKMMPAFAFRHIKDLYPLFWTKGRESVKAITNQILQDADNANNANNTGVIDVRIWASRTMLDIIGTAGLGRDFCALTDPDNDLIKTYRTITMPGKWAQVIDILALVFPPRMVRLLPLRRNKELRESVKLIRGTCRDLIEQKRSKLLKKELHDVDILSVALEAGTFTNDEELIDQTMTFLAGGHETTAAALTWAIYILCVHQDIQARLRAEIRSQLPSLSKPENVSSIDIDRLPYLNAFCSEVLRYFMSMPLAPRVAVQNTSIAGHPIPKGTNITVSPWAISKSKVLWGPDTTKFDPERWLAGGGGAAESSGTGSNYFFMPFLHGPRSCIGQTFSKSELACVVAAWVGQFEFELKNESEKDIKNIDVSSIVIFRPRNTLDIKVKVVEGW